MGSVSSNEESAYPCVKISDLCILYEELDRSKLSVEQTNNLYVFLKTVAFRQNYARTVSDKYLLIKDGFQCDCFSSRQRDGTNWVESGTTIYAHITRFRGGLAPDGCKLHLTDIQFELMTSIFDKIDLDSIVGRMLS